MYLSCQKYMFPTYTVVFPGTVLEIHLLRINYCASQQLKETDSVLKNSLFFSLRILFGGGR